MTPLSTFIGEQDKKTSEIFYPSSDGKPMADSTQQYKLIVLLVEGLKILFSENENVFIAGDLLWYPQEGNPKKCVAPDAMVVLGRPDHDRPSYKQWEEANMPPQVVFEVLSHSNTYSEMAQKAMFYDKYGVDEYYVLDCVKPHFEVWIRYDTELELIEAKATTWTSKLLNITIKTSENNKVQLFYPDGRKFLTTKELQLEKQQAELEKQQAELEKQQAELEKQQAEMENIKLKELLKTLGINSDTGLKI